MTKQPWLADQSFKSSLEGFIFFTSWRTYSTLHANQCLENNKFFISWKSWVSTVVLIHQKWLQDLKLNHSHFMQFQKNMSETLYAWDERSVDVSKGQEAYSN